MTSYRIPRVQKASRWLVVHFLRLFLLKLSRVTVSGVENIPESGSYLLIYNHVSLYDPPMIVCLLSKWPEMLGAVDIWSRPGQSLIARMYGGIPIQRGTVDRTAMSKMLSVLRAGYPLLVAPEGTRSHKPGMQRAKTGIVYLVEKTGVPVVPIGITGTTDDFLKQALTGKQPEVRVRIGSPFALPDVDSTGLTPAEIRQKKVDLMMRKIAELLPRDYQGVYAD